MVDLVEYFPQRIMRVSYR